MTDSTQSCPRTPSPAWRVIAALLVLLGILWGLGRVLWPSKSGIPPESAGAEPANRGTSFKSGSAIGAPASRLSESPVVPSQGGEVSGAVRWPVQKLDRLLDQSGFGIQRIDVAPLDAASETALIARYRQAASIQTKFSILVVLAYGGTARSIPLFTNALLREFSGRIVTAEEHSMLIDIPVRLGILAHREPAAVQILLRGTEPAFYEGVDLFRCADRSTSIGLLQGRCIVALGFSGRPEVKEFLDYCFAHPGEVAATDLDVPIRDAVFYSWVIDRYGWERAMDEVLNDQMRRLGQMDAWRSTAEGKGWAIDWRKKVEALRAAKRAESETPER